MQQQQPTELTVNERNFIASLVEHAGYPVLQKIIDSVCQQATAEVVRVPPDAPNRRQLVNELQSNAYAMNQFAARVLKDIKFQVESAYVGVVNQEPIEQVLDPA
jgi:sulfatase maturation enzyme AslB (radical SAM superfamily)